MEDTVQTDVAAITDALKKRGCSEKVVEEVLRLYGFSTKKFKQKQPNQTKPNLTNKPF